MPITVYFDKRGNLTTAWHETKAMAYIFTENPMEVLVCNEKSLPIAKFKVKTVKQFNPR